MTKRILIIEDDPDILAIMEILFVEEGFLPLPFQTVTTVGKIRLLSPDIILLDVKITGSPKTGADMCGEIKANSDIGHLPVLLVSAERDLNLIAEACRADGYVEKPFDINALVCKVKELLY